MLLIIDEIQTGFGRTGRWFAFQHMDIQPDLICLGKAMAGGVPMGAIAIGPRVTRLPVGVHGSTFGGNPLACAAALATLRIIEERRSGLALSRARRLFPERSCGRLNPRLIREVRGLGLMIGIELKVRAMPVVKALADAACRC